MDISVIICTYNRSSVLKETLQSFLKLSWDKGISYELIIVDNNSSDDTKDVVNEFIRQDSRIKYVFEAKSGLSYARNTGIKNAQGKIVAFVDDDVYFDPKWLQEVLNIFRDYPDAACMGGRSISVFEEGRPDWISDEIIRMYSSKDIGDSIKYMEFPEHPFGLNMAFKSEIFKQVGIFNQELGRFKGSLLSNEEKDFFYRIHKAGLKTIYTPHAVLSHRIPGERTAKKWIMRRYYWQGISDTIFEQSVEPKPKKILIREAFCDLKWLQKRIIVGYISIKRIYWHIKELKFEHWAHYCYKAGVIRQKLYEGFSFKRQKAVS